MDSYIIVEKALSKMARRYGPLAAKEINRSRKKRKASRRSRKNIKGVSKKKSKKSSKE